MIHPLHVTVIVEIITEALNYYILFYYSSIIGFSVIHRLDKY